MTRLALLRVRVKWRLLRGGRIEGVAVMRGSTVIPVFNENPVKI